MYHNNCHDLMKAFHASHVDLLQNICAELKVEDKFDELCEKFLNTTFSKVKKLKKEGPKKPKSSYMFFCMEKRADVAKKNPTFKLGQISKEIGEMWSKTTEKGKAKFEKLAEADKKRYQDELNNLPSENSD